MKFRKYQHVERFGTSEVKNIELGTCYIFPKIDGTNSSVWLDDGEVKAGSRTRELTVDKDNAGFYSWVLLNNGIKNLLNSHPTIRLYGEWLVPHSLKTYRDTAWKDFYVFDVVVETGDDITYLRYEDYKPILDEFNVNYIPPLAIIKNASYEHLIDKLNTNHYLIADGKGIGEGIVIKNYDFVNQFGNTIWAKIVANEFKEKHSKTFQVPSVTTSLIEQSIVDKYITTALIEKTKAKIENETKEWKSIYIPRLLSTVFYDLVKEESYNFVKENKMPIINFKTLNTLCNLKVKQLTNNFTFI